jgi:serine/threonine protein kinase
MCSLRVPFQGVSLQDLYRKIKTGIINRIPSSYSEELYDVIKLMMTNNYKERPKAADLL